MAEEQYNLKESVEGIGKLVPVLKDAQGNIIDGFHRQKIDPNWPSVVCELVDNPTKLVKARLVSNFCRRRIPHEEIHDAIVFLVGKAGLKPDQIAEELGISRATIYRHLPQEMKDTEKAQSISQGIKSSALREDVSHETFTNVKSLRTTDMVECDCCGMGTNDPKPFGRYEELCEKCYFKALKYPRLFAREPPAKPKVQATKPKESWTDRKARMQPRVSKMDEAMLIRLQNNEALRKAGWRVEFQKPRTKILCVSDVTLINPEGRREIDVFFDHAETHKNKQFEDESHRQEAAALHNIEYLPLPYHAVTETEKARLEKEVLKATATSTSIEEA